VEDDTGLVARPKEATWDDNCVGPDARQVESRRDGEWSRAIDGRWTRMTVK
jgi:hypothetical protein